MFAHQASLLPLLQYPDYQPLLSDFSITIGTPSFCCKLGEASRATASVEPPGAKGTTIRIGPFGQAFCAYADDVLGKLAAPMRVDSRVRRNGLYITGILLRCFI